MRAKSLLVGILLGLLPVLATGCDTPRTRVVLDNDYPTSASTPLVVYRAFWQSVSFPSAVEPGASSEPQNALAASTNVAYALLAPGWDVTSSTAPTSFIVLESRDGFELHLNDTLHIPVDDTTFFGNCAANSVLSPEQADFIVRRVFASDFASLDYDATTCTTTAMR